MRKRNGADENFRLQDVNNRSYRFYAAPVNARSPYEARMSSTVHTSKTRARLVTMPSAMLEITFRLENEVCLNGIFISA